MAVLRYAGLGGAIGNVGRIKVADREFGRYVGLTQEGGVTLHIRSGQEAASTNCLLNEQSRQRNKWIEYEERI